MLLSTKTLRSSYTQHSLVSFAAIFWAQPGMFWIIHVGLHLKNEVLTKTWTTEHMWQSYSTMECPTNLQFLNKLQSYIYCWSFCNIHVPSLKTSYILFFCLRNRKDFFTFKKVNNMIQLHIFFYYYLLLLVLCLLK